MATHAEAAPKGPIETPPPHSSAYMDMPARRAQFDGFFKLVLWMSMLLVLTVGYAVFTLTMHVTWIGAMIGFAAFGVIAGLLLNMGGAWIATVVGLCVLGVVIEALIWLGTALIQ
jgi:hypothetical protein